MTVGSSGGVGGELNLAWLHCNECHRSFEHHNRLSEDGEGGLRVMRSDLTYSFTSCGHIFCEPCIEQHTIGGRPICTLCNQEATTFKINDHVPKALEMYLKTPISQLEDSISVMSFQISNASLLIKSLRSKLAQQKELISKAKQELASQKLLKEKLNELQQENDRLRKRLDDVSRVAGDGSESGGAPSSKPPASPTPAIHAQGRLSLRSPIRIQAPSQTPHHHQRSPSISEIYLRPPSAADWNAASSGQERQRSAMPISNPYYDYYTNSDQSSQSMHATPDSRRQYPAGPLQPPRTFPMRSSSCSFAKAAMDLPPSPRPVYRQRLPSHLPPPRSSPYN